MEERLGWLNDDGKVVIQSENCEDSGNTLLTWDWNCFLSEVNDDDIFFLDQKSYCCYDNAGDTSFLMNNGASSLSHNLGCMMGSVLFYDAAL